MNYAQFPPVSTKDKQGLSKEFFTLSSCALVCADVSTVIISNDKIIAPPSSEDKQGVHRDKQGVEQAVVIRQTSPLTRKEINYVYHLLPSRATLDFETVFRRTYHPPPPRAFTLAVAPCGLQNAACEPFAALHGVHHPNRQRKAARCPRQTQPIKRRSSEPRRWSAWCPSS